MRDDYNYKIIINVYKFQKIFINLIAHNSANKKFLKT